MQLLEQREEFKSGGLFRFYCFDHKDVFLSLYDFPATSLEDHSWRILINMILSIQQVLQPKVYDFAALYPSTMLLCKYI